MKREEFYAARRLYRSQVSAIRWHDECGRQLDGARILHSRIWSETHRHVRECTPYHQVRYNLLSVTRDFLKTAIWANSRGTY